MGKFIITEEEKRQILSKYGLLSEQKPKEYAGPTPEEIEQSLPAQRVAWRANQIQSQNLGTSYEDAEKQAYNELQNLFSPEEKVYWRANELKKADPNLPDEDAEAKARIELKVPNYNVKSLETIKAPTQLSNVKQTTAQASPITTNPELQTNPVQQSSFNVATPQYTAPQPSTTQQTTTSQKQYAGGPSLDPDAYEKFQKENPQPSSAQQVQNTVGSALNNAISSVGSKVGAAVTTAQSAPNYNVNYKVLTPQKLTNIRTQINSTGKGNALTPEDLQALYTTISKLPNKK